MVICRYLVGCFVGQFDYEDGFGYLCCGRFSVLVRRFYNSGFRTGRVVHCVHCPHSFQQLVHLIFRQRRYGGALLTTRQNTYLQLLQDPQYEELWAELLGGFA